MEEQKQKESDSTEKTSNSQNLQSEQVTHYVSSFVQLLRIIAIIVIIIAVIGGYQLSLESNYFRDEVNVGQWLGWIFVGILCCCVLWALSIIVDACQKYLNNE